MSNLPEEKVVGHQMEAWKTAITVQQHFNTLEMQIRNFAVTVLTAVLSAAILSLKLTEPVRVYLFGLTLSSASLILTGGLLAWLSFYLMDRFWYHRLLKGAVGQAQKLEQSLAAHIPGIGLSKAIGDASAVKVGDQELHTDAKLDIFYIGIALILVALIVFLANA